MLCVFFLITMQKMLRPLFSVTRTSPKANPRNARGSQNASALQSLQGHKKDLPRTNGRSVHRMSTAVQLCVNTTVRINAEEQAVAESEYYDSSDANASGTESESSGSSDDNASDTGSESSDSSSDVLVLDHKPSNWVDKPNRTKRGRTDDDDEVIVLDRRPDDWIDKMPGRIKRSRLG
ncbi:uncharacterized protein HD556DRAFT_1450712 [Suillus plorans]|uniref:Uncharacterized protein n=1 Tax=Suillus plorans TaxID=116603 RepID=A0A9P7DAB6_9AGAM|nr:uncharacterized protein HD556DRAFT_1314406 [Suillus plorans]XP_041152928.1 uncharacterized protein HD556DRAFT_1314229 [Suillus plorans]XP_041152970.1 uncharacterized protein HD556DRAFT_1450712 [Suillus plorans]KAG1785294.1 hypothetical protein HD556DRAFT_1314406 [Suillus plorans]KAG1785445.1 hypothetical protein HD556DRAFT_1314229 [Suillus plorans]KAG1785487.1 hypothetical protein HD556DRAFT_1450712 [Suillus plorans]